MRIRRVFENNNEEFTQYLNDCFIDVIENVEFEVDDIIEVPVVGEYDDINVYKIHIKWGNSNKINVVGNPYIGKARVDLDFLKIRNKTMMDLLEDIEISIDKLKYKYEDVNVLIDSNREGNLDILIVKK